VTPGRETFHLAYRLTSFTAAELDLLAEAGLILVPALARGFHLTLPRPGS